MGTALPSSPRPTSVELVWNSNALSYVSPVSGAVQTSSRLGGNWMLKITLPPMNQHQNGSWSAVLMGADGPATALEAGPERPKPVDFYNVNSSYGEADAYSLGLFFTESTYYVRYIDAPTMLVNGAASAAATSLAIDGMDGIGLNAGDIFSVSNGTYNELHIVTADAFPNSSGEATLSIHPPLRRGVADNATVNFELPTGEFILAKQDTAGFVTGRHGLETSKTIELREFVR